MKVDLAGRVALVTGAGRGIGKAIANSFAANGARVLYSDIDLATATEAATAFPGCQAVALDVTSSTQVEEVIALAVRDLGRLDIVVNNAGVNTLQHRVTIDQFPIEEWDRILKVDLHGLFLVSRAAARVKCSSSATATKARRRRGSRSRGTRSNLQRGCVNGA